MTLLAVVKALFYDYRNCCACILEYTKRPWCLSLVSICLVSVPRFFVLDVVELMHSSRCVFYSNLFEMKVRLLNWDGSIYLGVLFETEVPARSHLEGREQLSGMEEAEKLHFLSFV